MVFKDQGGVGGTPNEVLLHAAVTGETIRFTRQDTVEAESRVVQALLDAAPPLETYGPGSWGPDTGKLLGEHCPWRGPWAADASAATAPTSTAPWSGTSSRRRTCGPRRSARSRRRAACTTSRCCRATSSGPS